MLQILLIVETVLYLLHFAIVFYLPDFVPFHWNSNGTADFYVNKWWYLLYDLIPFIVIWLFWFPLKSSTPSVYINTSAWKLFSVSFCFLMMAITWIPEYLIFTKTDTLQSAIANIHGLVLLLVGIIFILLGNFLPQVLPNRYFGAKTPWTKNDKQNWKKTNHLYSALIFGTGILCIIGALFHSFWIQYLGAAVVFLTLTIYIYSFYLYYTKKK